MMRARAVGFDVPVSAGWPQHLRRTAQRKTGREAGRQYQKAPALARQAHPTFRCGRDRGDGGK